MFPNSLQLPVLDGKGIPTAMAAVNPLSRRMTMASNNINTNNMNRRSLSPLYTRTPTVAMAALRSNADHVLLGNRNWAVSYFEFRA